MVQQEADLSSFVETEYIAAAYASQEAVRLCQLLEDLGEPISQPTVLYEDNQRCIKRGTMVAMIDSLNDYNRSSSPSCEH